MRNENGKRPRVRIDNRDSASRDGEKRSFERAPGTTRFSSDTRSSQPRSYGEERDGNRRFNNEQRPERPSYGAARPSDGNRSSYRPAGASGDKPSFGSDGRRVSGGASQEGRTARPSYGSDRSQRDDRSGGRSYGSSRSGDSGNYRPSFGGGDRSQGGFRKPFVKRDGEYDPHAKYSQKKQIEYKKQFVDYTKPMRLNKFLSNSGLCSRREADDYIQAGVVSVNGSIINELGAKIIPATDKVLFHDQLVRSEKRVYILLNKPKDCVTTADDPQARLTVLDLVKNACSERVYPVGRLDRHTTGVLLITNDGDLTSKMTHPKYNQKKIYHAVLDRDITPEDMEKLRTGIELEDGEIHVDEINYIDQDDQKQVGVEIHSGRNRIVRRMFDHLGYKVARLDRVYFAGLTKKNLPRGKWRHLSEMEVNMLKMTN